VVYVKLCVLFRISIVEVLNEFVLILRYFITIQNVSTLECKVLLLKIFSEVFY